MDPRRFLILAAASLLLSGCAVFRPPAPERVAAEPAVVVVEPTAPDMVVAEAAEPPAPTEIAVAPAVGQPYLAAPDTEPEPAKASGLSGRSAIAAANTAARASSREDGFVGGVQMFDWSPGRVYEVWTAPLRVTTLSLAPGETLVAKAAGDTVRWQIGEAISGVGAAQVTHVLLKPLERGLETNLVLTTNRRVYLINLRSGGAEAFNAAIAWDFASLIAEPSAERAAPAVPVSDPVVMPEGEPDGRYRIEPHGRRPRWTPTSVFNDGRRTFITFDADLQVDEAPVLFVIAPDGESQMVNYRQVGGLFVVDRIFERAELRLGDRRPQIVRIRRVIGARS